MSSSDRATLAKARRELEELYLGVPDDSVNLTFQDFAQLSSQNHAGKNKPNPSSFKKMDSISESTPKHHHSSTPPSHMAKVPSLDFSTGLEAAALHQNHHVRDRPSPLVPLPPGSKYQAEEISGGNKFYDHGLRPEYKHGGDGHGMVNSMGMAYDDVSMASMYQEKVGRRRPGIPHSNICAVCSVYIYMFRNRCLVCGRVYCRQCLNIGMGEMTEGRKCVDCLGRKFSQRYIHRAGDVGCWSSCLKGYPNGVMIQELKWAEKGPKRSMHNRSIMMSDSRSPLGAPRTPNRTHLTSSPPSFITTPEYSPYATPTRHHLPF